jgi:hypothetical protein
MQIMETQDVIITLSSMASYLLDTNFLLGIRFPDTHNLHLPIYVRPVPFTLSFISDNDT